MTTTPVPLQLGVTTDHFGAAGAASIADDSKSSHIGRSPHESDDGVDESPADEASIPASIAEVPPSVSPVAGGLEAASWASLTGVSATSWADDDAPVASWLHATRAHCAQLAMRIDAKTPHESKELRLTSHKRREALQMAQIYFRERLCGMRFVSPSPQGDESTVRIGRARASEASKSDGCSGSAKIAAKSSDESARARRAPNVSFKIRT